MKKITKVLLVLLVALMMLPLTVSAVADNETVSDNIKIEVTTNKAEYKATGVAKITATITNTGSEDIENITAQAVFDDLSPVSKRNSQTSKSVDVLKSGESISFTYKATLNKSEHKLNIFQKIILFFVRLFNGGYNASSSDIDVITENVTEIKFGKFTAENVIQVGYATVENGNEEVTDEEFENYIEISEKVEYELKEIQASEEYKNLTTEEKVNFIENKLNTLKEEGMIKSFTYSEYNCSFSFEYSNGFDCVFVVENKHDNCYSSISTDVTTSSKYRSESEFATVSYSTTSITYDTNWLFQLGVSAIKDENATLTLMGLEKQYTDLGIPIQRNAMCTVATYKELSGYNLIYIMSHGSYNDNNSTPYICTTEIVTKEKKKDYKSDNILVYISEEESYFGIYPSFFENIELNDSIMLLGFCCAFGDQNKETTAFYESFRKAGADAVVGFCNSVNQSYSNGFIEKILYCLSKGKSIGYAYQYAIEILGSNDKIFLETYSEYTKEDYPAYPLIFGETDKKIFNGSIDSLCYFKATIKNIITEQSVENVSAEITKFENGNGLACYTKTNSAGNLEVELPKGTYYCTLYKDEYKKEKFSFKIEENETTTDIIFLTPTNINTITGTVTNRNSFAPISDVTIEVKENNGDVSAPVITTVTTDENGQYSLTLPYGNYILTLTHEAYNTLSSTLTVNSENTVNDITLLSNAIVVPLPDKYTVTYTVLDETTEQPIPNVSVNVTEQGDSFDNVIESVTTDENGQITLTLPEGDYVLSLSHDNYQSNIVPVTINSESNNGSIYLTPTRKVTASGDCGADGDNVKWVLYEDGELVISGSGEMENYLSGNAPWYSNRSLITNITIGDGVTSIGNYAFYYCTKLKNITIPNSVTIIGKNAFYRCTSLTGIIIPNSITTINDKAFESCSSLASIIIPESVIYIGENAFMGCENLVSINVDDKNQHYSSDLYGVLYNKDKTTLIQYPKGNIRDSYTIPDGVVDIGYGAFRGCSAFTSITIPESVTNISDYVFASCSNLTSMIIPENVTNIGSYAFWYCTSLLNIVLPKNIDTIRSGTLQNCTNLTNIIIPNGVTKILDCAFSDCTNLVYIEIPDTVKYIEYTAFNNTGYYNSAWESDVLYVGNHLIKAKTTINGEYEIKNGCVSISPYAFSNCTQLTSIKIADSVTSISHSIFNGCTNLKELTMPISAHIEYGLGCSVLEKITLTKGNGIMQDFSFLSGSSSNGLTYYQFTPWYTSKDTIQEIIIEDGVSYIGEYAFYQCTGVSSMTIPNSITEFGYKSFSGTDSLYDIYYSGTEDEWNNIEGVFYQGEDGVTIHYNS